MLKGTGVIELVVDGKVLSAQEVDNTFMFAGADVIGLMLAGKRGPPRYAYLEFFNGASPGSLPDEPGRDEGKSYYDAIAGAESPDRDYVRVPLLFSPALTPTSAEYESNAVNFVITSDLAPEEGKAGLPFGNAAGSSVYGAAIVSEGDTEESDLVFARLYLTSPIAVPAAGAVHIRWKYSVFA